MRPAGRISAYMPFVLEMFGRISQEQRVALMLHGYAVGGGQRGCGDLRLSLKRKGFRFPTASSQPMALTRPPGDGVSRREIVYQKLTRGARHPTPTLARFVTPFIKLPAPASMV